LGRQGPNICKFVFIFDRFTRISRIADDLRIPGSDLSNVKVLAQLNFMTLDLVAETTQHDALNVFAVAHKVGDVGLVTLKSGVQKQRRNILLVDQSFFSVVACIWIGDQSSPPAVAQGDVVALLAAKSSDFGGKSINVSDDAQVFINPPDPRVTDLKAWYSKL
jgi:replication factor A1